MKYLNYSKEELEEAGGLQTAKEIRHQPDVWIKTADKFFKESKSIKKFLESALKEADNIILTGAGSSSFIGQAICGILFSHFHVITRPIPTTHIVSHPGYYFSNLSTPLIISFARSGDSPESHASLELADKYNRKCFHLIITCHAEGTLANYKSKNPVWVIVLPEEANDKGLAMTSSFTSMLLSGLLLNFLDKEKNAYEQLELSVQHARHILSNNLDSLKTIAKINFTRGVFLGSGPLYGTALEACLKLQELTNGHIICKGDTFLGFRHGPKVIINENTLVVYFLSNNKYASMYEMDLIHSIHRGNKALLHIGISESQVDRINIEELINISDDGKQVGEDFQPLCYIVPIQVLSFYKSILLGLKPDTPSLNGAISRVVEGVSIYPVEV
jgi:tagatose-6-phosphate ketose/aldose isomerase